MIKNLKIAIIGSRGYPYVYSGYETLVKELSERLVEKGHNVTVYCHRPLFKKRPKNINGIDLIYTPAIETKFLSQFVNSFFSFLHVCFSKMDVVLVVNSANGPFGLFTKFLQIPTAINVDGLEWLRPKWRGLGSVYFRVSSKLATLFFDKIITDSVEMSKIYIKKFKKKSNVIAYGPTIIESKKKLVLNKYKLKAKEYYLIVGRLIPDNNSELIIKGFLNSNSSKKIVIVGDVPYNDYFSKRVKRLNSEKVIFTGYIKDQINLSSLYKDCYAYIHGHEFGGTNPTMINALFLNCEILALNTKFNVEMLKNKKALYFEKELTSVSEIFNEFERNYFNNKKKNKGYKLPKIYDWNFIADKYEDIFYELTSYQSK